MPEPEPRKLLLKVILALFFLLLLLAGGAVLILWLKPHRSTSARLLLPDGTTVSVAGTTFGTNHVIGGTLARLVARTPWGMQVALGRLLGSGVVTHQALSTPTPTLVVWLDSPTIAPASPPRPFLGWYEGYLADTNGFVSGSDQTFYPGVGGLFAMQFSAFPRRNRTLALHFYFHDTQGKVKQCGTLTVLNPEFRAYSQWQPETLPATKMVGDVKATLIQVTTGLGNDMSYSPLPDGGHVVTFSTNHDDGRNETGCCLLLRSPTDSSQIWQVDHVELSDATGNVLRSTSMSSGGADDIFSFGPSLWTNESAWKLRCEIKRTKGFAAGELFTFKNVPVPEMLQTNYPGWATNVNGVTVTLDHIIRRPSLTNLNGGWSTSQLSEAHFRMTGLSNDLHLDLIEIRADNGTNVESPSSSTGDNMQDRYLRNIPPETKTLDFTFAVQRGRWVEFLVKPETGSGRFEFPAPPKSKTAK
ncbi:MAG TPA: hypothetical protein VN048_05900 [Verrucomicrobiae bacterium]|nr:hypothetical protein [Verrucomicrobiae bacterium]